VAITYHHVIKLRDIETATGVVMRVHAFWVAAIALCLTACGRQEPAEPQQPLSDPAAAEPMPAKPEFDQGFIDHMHAHADHLDELMFALADGDLNAALTPAYWLSRHESVTGIPEDWEQYVTAMRDAAFAVETADDLDAARVAAEAISDQCQGCHTAAGVTFE
jgi:mono/diheme cytochrome c family protein